MKVFYCSVEVLIFDELIGVLIFVEVDYFFKIFEVFKNEGKMVLLIIYKLCEIMVVIDMVFVMCCGEMVVIW